MGQFSIGEAWSQAMAFFNDNLRMLILWVGLPIVVIGAIQGIFFGIDQAAMNAVAERAVRTGDWAPMLAAMGGAGLGIFSLVGAVVQSATEFAALRMGLGHDEEPGSAISYGLAAAALSLLLYLAIGIGFGIVIAVIVLGFVGAAASGASGTGAAAAAAGVIGLLVLVLLPALLWLSARFAVAQAVMADARSSNPLFGLAASWRLTAANQWAILGYLVLLVIAAAVVFGIVGGVAGVIGGLLGPSVAAILNAAVVSAPASILGVAVVAGIYRTLAPSQTGNIFS